MALEYTLLLQEPAQPAEAAARLVASGDFAARDDGITAPDLLVWVRAPGALSELIEDEFGFVPRVQVSFRIDRDGDADAARLRIIRACGALLQAGRSDAVLLFNDDNVVLLREQGRLLLNRELGFWSEARRALLGLPHELEDIPHI
jgi:hypothetical protein